MRAARGAIAGPRWSPTTQFEWLCRRTMLLLHPEGSSQNHFVAPPYADAYARGVKPDFVLPDGRWIDFKLRVSFRDKQDVPWRPSALYSSLRKYIDHPANRAQSLIIVYRHLHGTIDDAPLPVTRGRKVLIRDRAELQRRVTFVDIRRVLAKLDPRFARPIERRVLAL